ncbi:MAG: hypothetical protein NTY38_18045, partial [Acidobacteria bacterium]|nr:hypothetical protein [Acidobacteriota bacterium]
VAVAMVGAGAAGAQGLVTVFTYDTIGVPPAVMAKAQRVAAGAFGKVGVEVRWVRGTRLEESRKVDAGEALVLIFDGPAAADASPRAMASTSLGGGVDPQVRVFYHRVVSRGNTFWDRVHMPEVLGNVLAHELTHALEGVARHSAEGLMKAVWNSMDYVKMADGPLAFAPVDVGLLRAHFGKHASPAPVLAAAR